MNLFIESLKALLFGIVEGITEWLPISSTGHMILVDEFVKLNVSAEFLELFLVVIQLGAIMAVLILYFHKLNPVLAEEDVGREARHVAAVGHGGHRLHPGGGHRTYAGRLLPTSTSTTRGRWPSPLSSTASCSSCWSVATVGARQPIWPVAPPGVPAAPMRVPCPRWVRATMATTPRWPCSACAPWTRSTGRRR